MGTPNSDKTTPDAVAEIARLADEIIGQEAAITVTAEENTKLTTTTVDKALKAVAPIVKHITVHGLDDATRKYKGGTRETLAYAIIATTTKPAAHPSRPTQLLLDRKGDFWVSHEKDPNTLAISQRDAIDAFGIGKILQGLLDLFTKKSKQLAQRQAGLDLFTKEIIETIQAVTKEAAETED